MTRLVRFSALPRLGLLLACFALAGLLSTGALAAAASANSNLLTVVGSDSPARQTSINPTFEIVFHPQSGEAYFINNDRQIKKVTTDGRVVTVAGTEIQAAGSPDGPVAQNIEPMQLRFDSIENELYFIDGDTRIRKITADEQIVTIAGTLIKARNSADGPASQDIDPKSFKFHPESNEVYFNDGDLRIRKITTDPLTRARSIVTVVGTTTEGYVSEDGPTAQDISLCRDRFSFHPETHELYFTDSLRRIRKITNDDNVVTVAGTTKLSTEPSSDGAAFQNITVTEFKFAPHTHEVYFTDDFKRIRKITEEKNAEKRIVTVVSTDGKRRGKNGSDLRPIIDFDFDPVHHRVYFRDSSKKIKMVKGNEEIVTVAGTSTRESNSEDGATAQNIQPIWFGFNSVSRELYFNDGSTRIRKVTRGHERVVTLAGMTRQNQPDGPTAQEIMPRWAGFDPVKNELYFIDNLIRIRKVTAGGHVVTVVGNEESSRTSTGESTQQSIMPLWVAFHPVTNELYFNDANCRFRKVTKDGKVVTVAGKATAFPSSDSPDGPATQNIIAFVFAFDPVTHELHFDDGHKRLRKVTTDPVTGEQLIVTVAGTTRAAANSPDGLAAQNISLDSFVFHPMTNEPYFIDGRTRIRRVTADPVTGERSIVTVAGTTTRADDSVDGPATERNICPTVFVFQPHSNELYFNDGNKRLRKITKQGQIVTIAGTTTRGVDSPDGPATERNISPKGKIHFDPRSSELGKNELYFIDGDRRIREVTKDGQLVTVAGTTAIGNSPDGVAHTRNTNPTDFYGFVPNGEGLYFADWDIRIRVVTERVRSLASLGSAKVFDGLEEKRKKLTIPSSDLLLRSDPEAQQQIDKLKRYLEEIEDFKNSYPEDFQKRIVGQGGTDCWIRELNNWQNQQGEANEQRAANQQREAIDQGDPFQNLNGEERPECCLF